MVTCTMEPWSRFRLTQGTRHHLLLSRESVLDMSRSPRGHGPMKIVVGLALTGFAFVIAGRKTHWRDVIFPSPFSSAAERRTADPEVRVPTMANLFADPPMAKAKAETSVGLSEIPVASAAPIPAAATPSVPIAGDSLAANRFVPNDGRDSFDDVMSRVTTMLETASQRCLRTHQIYESSRTRAV